MPRQPLGAIIAGLLLPVFVASPAVAEPPGWWTELSGLGFAGRVSSIHPWQGGLLVAGHFAANGHAPMHMLANWDGRRWGAVADLPPFLDSHHAATHDGLIVSNGVNSSWIDDGPYMWDGNSWQVMDSGISGYLPLLFDSASFEGDLFLGGNFTGLGCWDGTTLVLETSPIFGGVYGFAVHGSWLYATGDFALDGDIRGYGLARFDGNNWEPVVGIDPVGGQLEGGLDGYGRGLAVHEGQVIVVGNFDQVGTMPASNIVGYDTGSASWVPYPPLDEGALTTAGYGGQLYVGGSPGLLPGTGDWSSLLRLGAGGWEDVGIGPDDTVTDLHTGAQLYIAGHFRTAGGELNRGMVAWNGSRYLRMSNPYGAGLDGRVAQLVPWQGELLAAGSFLYGGHERLNRLATFDGTAWQPFPGGGSDGAIEDLYLDGAHIYIAGAFDLVGGTSCEGLARWDGVQWQGMGAGLPARPSRVAAIGDDVYAASRNRWEDGSGNSHWGYLACHNGVSWTIVLAGADVGDLMPYAGEMWATLTNYEVGGSSYNYATLSGATMTPRFPSLTGASSRLQVGEGKLWLLGQLHSWDGSSLVAHQIGTLDYPADLPSGVLMGPVKELCFTPEGVYIASQGDRTGITAWLWDRDTNVASALDRGTNAQCLTVAELNGSVYFGGDFTLAGFPPAHNFNATGNAVPSGYLARWVDPTSIATATPPGARAAWITAAPNPFNPRTIFHFRLHAAMTDLELQLHDARGRVVHTVDLGDWPAGEGAWTWAGDDTAGRPLGSGIYFYRLEAAGELLAAGKVTLVR